MSRHRPVQLQPIDPTATGAVPSASPWGRFARTVGDALGVVQRGCYTLADDLDDAADMTTRPAPAETELIEVGAAARWLDVPESTLQRLCLEQKVPAVKIGGRWRVNRSALLAASTRRETSR